MDFNEIAKLDTRGVDELGELIKSRNIPPENIRFHISKNIIEGKGDYEIWGINDYWATPYETLQKGAGDCEDLSILTKSVSDYLDKDEEYKERYKLKIIIQDNTGQQISVVIDNLSLINP